MNEAPTREHAINLLLLAALNSSDAVQELGVTAEVVEQLLSLSDLRSKDIESCGFLLRNYAHFLAWCVESEKSQSAARESRKDSAK